MIVRFAIYMEGAKCYRKEKREAKVHVVKMSMLRGMFGVTKKDKIIDDTQIL